MNRVILLEHEYVAIEQAVIKFCISGEDVAQIAQVFGLLSIQGVDWRQVVTHFLQSNPHIANDILRDLSDMKNQDLLIDQ